MQFNEMLLSLHAGQYAARAGWTTEYICVMPGMQHIWQIKTQPSANAGNWLPSVEDLLASDWSIITTMADLQPKAAEPAEPAPAE